MKFAHAVKHNGVLYPAGANVPIGTEPVKVDENKPKEITVAEIIKELKEFGIDAKPQVGKVKLLAMLEEAKNKPADPKTDDEGEGDDTEEETEDGEEGTTDPKTPEGEEGTEDPEVILSDLSNEEE